MNPIESKAWQQSPWVHSKYSLPGQTADLIPLAMKSSISPSIGGIFAYVMDVSPAPPKIFSISLSSKPCLCGTRWWYSSGTGDSMLSMMMRAPEGLRKWVKSRVTWETSSKWWYAAVHYTGFVSGFFRKLTSYARWSHEIFHCQVHRLHLSIRPWLLGIVLGRHPCLRSVYWISRQLLDLYLPRESIWRVEQGFQIPNLNGSN